jgi:hypothetical protein
VFTGIHPQKAFPRFQTGSRHRSSLKLIGLTYYFFQKSIAHQNPIWMINKINSLTRPILPYPNITKLVLNPVFILEKEDKELDFMVKTR